MTFFRVSKSAGFDLGSLLGYYDPDEVDSAPAHGKATDPRITLLDVGDQVLLRIFSYLHAKAVYRTICHVSKAFDRVCSRSALHRQLVENHIQSRYQDLRRLAGIILHSHSALTPDSPDSPDSPESQSQSHPRGGQRLLRHIESESSASGSWYMYLISLFLPWKIQTNIETHANVNVNCESASPSRYGFFLNDSEDEDDFVDSFLDDVVEEDDSLRYDDSRRRSQRNSRRKSSPSESGSTASTILYVRNSNVINLDQKLENRGGTFCFVEDSSECVGFSSSAKDISLKSRTLLFALLWNEESGEYQQACINLLDIVRLTINKRKGVFVCSLEWRSASSSEAKNI